MISLLTIRDFKDYKAQIGQIFKGSVFRKCDAEDAFEDKVLCDGASPKGAYVSVLKKINMITPTGEIKIGMISIGKDRHNGACGDDKKIDCSQGIGCPSLSD